MEPPPPNPHAPSTSTPQPPASHVHSAGAKRKADDHVTNGVQQITHPLPKKPKTFPLPDASTAVTEEPKIKTEHVIPGEGVTGTPTCATATIKPPAIAPPGVLPTGIWKDRSVELWQQVFTYLPPASLSRCLRVCKDFHTILVHIKDDSLTAAKKKTTKVTEVKKMDSNVIWAHARKVWFPALPKPLAGYTELQMLQLIGRLTCQFCFKASVPSSATSVLNSGPGFQGVRVIWPFKIRSCGDCLSTRIQKVGDAVPSPVQFMCLPVQDVDILLSPAAPLRVALPFAFITADLNYIPESLLSSAKPIPLHNPVSKVYYTANVKDIATEHRETHDFGESAVANWREGLPARGKETKDDATRWEKWETASTPRGDLAEVLRQYDFSSFPKMEARRSVHVGKYEPPTTIKQDPHETQAWSQPMHTACTPAATAQMHSHPPYHLNGYGSAQALAPATTFGRPQTYQQTNRPPLSAEDAEMRRQARRQEIERRCMDLDPPLNPELLDYMPCMDRAMMTTAAMTDQGWNMLKSQIEEQRDAAYAKQESEYQERIANALYHAAAPTIAFPESYGKPVKDFQEQKAYDAAQHPLRAKLGEYVTEFYSIYTPTERMDMGDATFAARAIVHVYKRYTEDKTAGRLVETQHVPAGRPNQQEPFLSLDNMKWVFEHCIKPDTDRPELFICAGCDDDTPKKSTPVAFESLMQHYAAKHTSDFTQGNVVVQWQASPWPEEPPFEMQPGRWIKSRWSNQGGRRKKTPQNSREPAFYPPGSRAAGPQTAHFGQRNGTSNGLHGGAQGYLPSSYGQSNRQAPRPEDAYRAPEISEDTKTNKFAADIVEIWDALSGVNDMMSCVRLFVTLQTAVTRFREAYNTLPSLDAFMSALVGNPTMDEVKKAKGLACKVCVAHQPNGMGRDRSYYARVSNMKLYTASALTNHFKIAHAQDAGSPTNWTVYMIELPDTKDIGELLHAPGITDEKLALIDTAFPTAFPKPLPSVDPYVTKAGFKSAAEKPALPGTLLDRFNKKNKGGKKKGGQQNGHSTRGGSREFSAPASSEHEYDPRKPMTYTKKPEDDAEADAARFDTDLARPAKKAAVPAPEFNMGLAPETLKALQALQLPQSQPHESQSMERRPSVGAPTAKPTSSGGSVQPDIAAILASLNAQPAPTPQPQTAATPPSREGGYRVPSYQPRAESYAPQQMMYRPTESSPPASDGRYIAPGNDLQAALERNARGYERNHSQYEQPPQQHMYGQPRYIDEGPAPSQPPMQYQPRIREVEYSQSRQQSHHAPTGPPPAAPPGVYAQRYAQAGHHQAYETYPAPQQYPQQQAVRYVDQNGNEVHLVPAPDGREGYEGYGRY